MNNVKKAQQLIDCYNKNNPNQILMCFGPTGPTGPTGPRGGTSTQSSYGDIFYTSFNESPSGLLTIDTPWLIPNPTDNYSILNDTNILVKSGVYEIMLSGIISNTDATHGGQLYLQDEYSSEIKALSFTYPVGSGTFAQFSDTTILRLENDTTLSVNSLVLGDIDTSNVTFSNVNLSIKRINNL